MIEPCFEILWFREHLYQKCSSGLRASPVVGSPFRIHRAHTNHHSEPPPQPTYRTRTVHMDRERSTYSPHRPYITIQGPHRLHTEAVQSTDQKKPRGILYINSAYIVHIDACRPTYSAYSPYRAIYSTSIESPRGTRAHSGTPPTRGNGRPCHSPMPRSLYTVRTQSI